MVDHVVGAKLVRSLHLPVITGGGDHSCVEQLCNLDGCDTHAGVCAQHQNSLPRANRRAAGQHMKSSQQDQRHAGGFVKAKAVGNGNHIHRWNGHQFAVAAVHAIA